MCTFIDRYFETDEDPTIDLLAQQNKLQLDDESTCLSEDLFAN